MFVISNQTHGLQLKKGQHSIDSLVFRPNVSRHSFACSAHWICQVRNDSRLKPNIGNRNQPRLAPEVAPPQPAVCSQMTAWKWSKTFSPRGYCVAPRNHLLHHLFMGVWTPHNRWPDWFKNKSRLHVLEHSKESSASWWIESPKYRPMRLLMLWNHQPGCPYEVESATVDMFELRTASIASLMSWLWQ